jgi:SAM-dependent methyltransferase
VIRAGYTALPAYYDRWQKSYGKDYSTLIAPRLFSTLQRYQVPVSTFADVGCGTGTLALMLARRGWRGYGVDASPGMLREARAKVPGSNGNVQFLEQDMRTLALPGPVRVISALFDVLNHLTRLRDLQAALRAVHRLLLPSGLFIFDTNNERCYATLWNKTEAIEHRDFTLILRNTYLPSRRLARSHVTILPSKPLRANREQEIVRERCYTHDEIRETLAAAGFQILEGEDFNFTGVPGVGDLKTWWVAQK